MAWRTIDELTDDVYRTLMRVRGNEVPLRQAWVEAKLLDTGARLLSLKFPRPMLVAPEIEAGPLSQRVAPSKSPPQQNPRDNGSSLQARAKSPPTGVESEPHSRNG